MLSGLTSSASEGSAGLTPETRIVNAATAYFVLLMGLAQAKLNFKQDWERHYLPLVTVRNLCWSMVSAITVAIFFSGVDPSKFGEKMVESWYGRAKQGYRGTPSIRDGLYGQHREHLKQLSQPCEVDEFAAKVITCETAALLVDRAFIGAAGLMQHLSYKVASRTIQQNFQAWWKSEGEDGRERQGQ